MCRGPISISPIESNRIHRRFAVDLPRRRVLTTVTRRSAAVRTWIRLTRHLHRRRCSRLVVGLGVQWSPSRSPKPSTLQLCVGHRCLIFQISPPRSIPLVLIRFLEDRDVTFAAVGVRYDRRLLNEHLGLRVGNGVEIRNLAANIMRRRNASIHDMAAKILGLDYVREAKPELIGRSNWDVLHLSHKQIVYASVDAHVSFLLGLRLIRGY